MCISIEFNALANIKQDHVSKVFNDRIEMVKEYLIIRIGNTTNSLLKAKYYHLLYCLTKDNKDAGQALDNYNYNLENYLYNQSDLNRHVKFKELLDVVFQLTKKTKYKVDELKNQIHSFLKNPLVDDRIKGRIIDSTINSKLFKVEEMAYFPKLSCAIASRETTHRFAELSLLSGLNVAQKMQDEEAIKEINELLGDNEIKKIKEYDGRPESMMIPHQNNYIYIRVIQYFKRSGNKAKVDSATLSYNSNKKNTRFLKMNASINQKITPEKIKGAVLTILGFETKVIVHHLIWGDILPLFNNEVLDKYVEQEKDKEIYKLLKPATHDLNNNGKEQSVADHLRFEAYSQKIPLTVNFVSDIVLNTVQKKKLTYSKVVKILTSKLYFGQTLTVSRNGEDFDYTWFALINIGIKSFFDQFLMILKGKQPDWRTTVDMLSLKFEGILRDMVGLIDGVITKVDNKGNTSELLLEDLLRNKTIEKIFHKDDINLFQFVFTGKGYNIRNDVAHSFYKPQDYTVKKAILVILCILRLAKFNYCMAKDSLIESGNI